MAPQSVRAAPTVSSPFEQLYNLGTNTIGFNPGQYIRLGATVTSVTGPNGTSNNLDVIRTELLPANGGFAQASTTNLVTGNPVLRTMNYAGSPAIGALYTAFAADNPALRGPWTLSFSDGSGTTSRTTQAIPQGATQTPFVQSVAVTGAGNNPTFSWAPPPGTTVNGYRINIYDQGQISPTSPNGLVLSQNFAPNVTSLSLSSFANQLPAGYNIDGSSKKTIEINLLQTRDGGSSNLSNPNVLALSRVFADFTTTNTGNVQVYLPTAYVNGAKVFDFAVQPGVTYHIDPIPATGYVYEIGAGDPNFASVTLPDEQSDPYQLSFMWGGLSFLETVLGGVEYFFPAGGVSQFTVTGIDSSLFTAFITGLSFTGAGQFTGTQTPILPDGPTPVPEPGMLWLLVLASLGLWGVSRRTAGA
ncbi:hypothetical protein [Sabulicella rubraurantiaca]|uniref:hypothetical protein n=1 Tax=Sabulicella rubraurantiaca TaxID=2811429 RepID=UPI001A95F2EC|nr:hypothetical protein [Sabulicella rubraurantiaca]